MRALARENAEQGVEWHAVSLGDFAGFTASYLDEDTALREWYVAHGQQLLFITYSCDEENRGMDDAAVDQLLDTLLPVD